MREIKFRGMDHESRWWKGSFVNDIDSFICAHYLPTDPDLPLIRVKKNTVGQYIGIPDRNGVDIYEGDIISTPLFMNPAIVEYLNGYPGVRNNGKHFDLIYGDFIESEVIGNIHEFPELVTKKAKA